MSGSIHAFRMRVLLYVFTFQPLLVARGFRSAAESDEGAQHAQHAQQQSSVEQRVRALFCTAETPCYRAAPLPLAAGPALARGASCYGSGSAKEPAKLTIVTLAAGVPADYMRTMRAGRLREAYEYGYEYCEYDHPLDSARDTAWSKVVAIRVLLEHGRPYVAWMDADAVFVRHRPFEDITSPYFNAGKSAVFTSDFDEHGEATPHSSINSGVLVVKNTPWAAKFWKSIWEDFPEALHHPWWEQQAILLYRSRNFEDFSANAQIVKHQLMNAWLQEANQDGAQAGSFIVHAAGGHSMGKFAELEKLLNGTRPLV